MFSGLVVKVSPLVFEPGDQADQLRSLAQQGLFAAEDHDIRGRNWLAKHRSELTARINALWPLLYPDKPIGALEEAHLDKAVQAAFPGAIRLPRGVTAEEWSSWTWPTKEELDGLREWNRDARQRAGIYTVGEVFCAVDEALRGAKPRQVDLL